MSLALHPRLRELEKILAPAPLTQIADAEFSRRQIELWLKRDDLLHPVVSGNKWRKLKYVLNHAMHLGADTIVSMGGPYSNHLHALAFACKLLDLKSIAYIRGERPARLTPTLKDLEDWGVELRFVSRGEYRQLREFKSHDSLPDLKAGQYWVPEGGSTELALRGVGEAVAEIDLDFDVLVTACGTGATLAGLIANVPTSTRVLGVAALKGAGFLVYDIQQMLESQGLTRYNWQLALDYHCGGFGKTTPELLDFIRQFQAKHGVPLEPIYTGKALLAIFDLLKEDYFKTGERVVMLHTGGLQGKR